MGGGAVDEVLGAHRHHVGRGRISGPVGRSDIDAEHLGVRRIGREGVVQTRYPAGIDAHGVQLFGGEYTLAKRVAPTAVDRHTGNLTCAVVEDDGIGGVGVGYKTGHIMGGKDDAVPSTDAIVGADNPHLGLICTTGSEPCYHATRLIDCGLVLDRSGTDALHLHRILRRGAQRVRHHIPREEAAGGSCSAHLHTVDGRTGGDAFHEELVQRRIPATRGRPCHHRDEIALTRIIGQRNHKALPVGRTDIDGGHWDKGVDV